MSCLLLSSYHTWIVIRGLTLVCLVGWIFFKDFLGNPHFAQVSSVKAFQFEWPILTDRMSERITSTFAESRWDHFHNGLDISSFQEPVRAMGDGRLLYSRYESDDPFREEWGSGNTVWLDHGSGVYSAYYHLHPGRVRQGPEVRKGQLIGRSGNSGHSGGAHLHFLIAKDYGSSIVNPLRYLPPIQDTIPPWIGNLVVFVGERFSFIQSGDTIRLSGAFPFAVEVQDSGVRTSQRWGVESIQFLLNGRVYKESKFRSIRFRNGEWVNEDGLTFAELFYRDKYLIGNLSLPSGEHTIEIVAIDFHGNSARKSFTFYVDRIQSSAGSEFLDSEN